MPLSKNIDKKQKKVIWSLAKKGLGVSSDTLYALIMEMFSAERMSALTYNQAELLIKELRRKICGLGFNSLTSLQYTGIKRRAQSLGWTKEGLRKFIKAETGVDDISWLSVAQARMAITGMEKIKKWRANNPKEEQIDGIQ
ncbi:MAG: hypothetical protein Q4F74_04185 [Synergistaceae bacterium]|nr:hypothetical protein [Synergistaceae bacterium]